MDNKKAIEVLKTYLHEDDKEGEIAFGVAINALEKEMSEIKASKWVSIKDKLPRSGEHILAYWWEEDIHQIHQLYYFEKGDKFTFEDLTDDEKPFNIAKWLNDEYDREVEESGFYIYETDYDGKTKFTPHANIITHWMPLPQPPNNKAGLLGGLEMEDN